MVCKLHGAQFTSDNDKLVLISPNLTIYTKYSDKIVEVPTYGRPTLGECKCVIQADTHDLLIWNMGSGKFIDYLFIHTHIYDMVSSGIAMNASFNARTASLGDLGVKSSLSYSFFPPCMYWICTNDPI